MTNIEKVKRILDAGHWVKATWDSGEVFTITSYIKETFFITDDTEIWCNNIVINNCTIEVIQRIPTAYNPGDKVLVLSNPTPDFKEKEDMVGKVMEIDSFYNGYYRVWNYDKSDWFYFPHHCLSPAFEEDSLSGKEAKIVIDGKEYTCVIK